MTRHTVATALVALTALGAAAEGAWAQSALSSRTYAAEPSWSQRLPATTRWQVLGSWDRQAVLDRETGLVWQIAPSGIDAILKEAHNFCFTSAAGGRAGWRLPTLQELMRTLVEGSGRELVKGSPFPFLNGPAALGELFWTATGQATPGDATQGVHRVVAPFSESGAVSVGGLPALSPFAMAWCVQSSAAGAAEQ